MAKTGRLRVSARCLALLAFVAALVGGLLFCYQRGSSLAESAQEAGQRWLFLRRATRVSLEGPLEEQGDGVWRVAGQQVHVGAASLVGAPQASFVAGAWIRVQAIRREDGSLEARAIVFVSGTASEGSLEFVGQVVALPSDSLRGIWQIDDIALEVNGETALLPGGHVPQIGEQAEVKAVRRVNAPPLAKSITIRPSLLEKVPVEFEGEISQLPSGDSWIGTWMVSDVQVRVDEATKIIGTPGIGANVEISGLEEGPRSLRALEILIHDDVGQEIVVRGTIVEAKLGPALDTWAFAVQSGDKEGTIYRIRIDRHTFIDESRGPVAVNSWAEVRAMRQDDGSLLARYIRLSRP